jgi:hypothetical protein
MGAIGEGAATVARFLADRIADQSLRIVEALILASDEAWRTLEIALVGESLSTTADRADDRAFREQVRLFVLQSQLEGNALRALGRELVPRCLLELRQAREAGLLRGGDASALATRLGDLTRFGDPASLVAAQWSLADELAENLRNAGFPALALFVVLRPAADQTALPLLAVAVRYHFRRQVEEDPRLFQGLAFAQLERIGKAQEDTAANLAALMSRYVERLESRLGELKDTALDTQRGLRQLEQLLTGGSLPTSPPAAPHPAAAIEQPSPRESVAPGGREQVLLAHTGAVCCIAISPDGTRAVSGGADRGLWVWDLVNGREVRCLAGHRDRVCCLAFSPDGRRLLSSGLDQTVRLWDIEAGLEIRCLDRQTNRSAAFSPDGKTALCGSLYDGKVRLFDVASGKEIKRFAGHADWVVSLAFASDGKVALSAGLDKAIKLWDVATGRLLRTFPLRNVVLASVAFSPDGWRILSATSDGIIRGWDTFTGQELFRLIGHSDAVASVCISPDGESAASAGHDGTVRVWDLRTKREAKRFLGHQGPVLCAAFSPDGRTLLSGGEDGTVRSRPLE